MTILECLDSPTGLDRLKPAWEEILAGSEADGIFMHPEFIRCWWRAFGGGDRQLYLLALREGTELLAVAPLMAKLYPGGIRGLHIVGTQTQGQIDYGGIVYPRDRPDALPTLLSHLQQRSDWHWLRLRHIPARISLADHLREAARATGMALHRYHLTDCPYLVLPRSYQEIIRSVSRNLRGDLGRQQRRLEQLGRLEYRVFRDRLEMLNLLPVIFDQHVRRWTARDQPSGFAAQAFREFYEYLVTDYAATGRLHFSGLLLDERPIALHLGFVSADRFYCYKSTFDLDLAPYSPGKILLGASSWSKPSPRAAASSTSSSAAKTTSSVGQPAFARTRNTGSIRAASPLTCSMPPPGWCGEGSGAAALPISASGTTKESP